jgi:hypothetical protein
MDRRRVAIGLIDGGLARGDRVVYMADGDAGLTVTGEIGDAVCEAGATPLIEEYERRLDAADFGIAAMLCSTSRPASAPARWQGSHTATTSTSRPSWPASGATGAWPPRACARAPCAWPATCATSTSPECGRSGARAETRSRSKAPHLPSGASWSSSPGTPIPL